MKPSIAAVLIALLAALALGACGESKEDKAKSTVCDARADISKEVDQLTGLTASTVTVDGDVLISMGDNLVGLPGK